MSPSAARNMTPITEAIVELMPREGMIVEIASGTGEHVVSFAAALPNARWAPGDPDPASRRSIAAWTAHLKRQNIAPPHSIDVSGQAWRSGEQQGAAALDAELLDAELLSAELQGVICINMIHIAPFDATKGLIEGAGKRLAAGGRLFLYGPFARDGLHTAASNADFDASLKARNPAWGVRDLDRDIAPLADAAGLSLVEARAMPANNFSVVFEKA
ncbi:MAG: DUF938 domain-containing protein [Pseudomonadota bacterium]